MISIIVCTYNRQGLLRDLLESISKQTLDFAEFEVLIIDNNSNDSTSDISKIYTQQFSNFQYYLEQKQGLSHARNRGWEEASGKYIAFVDDDCKLPGNFLLKAKEIIQKRKADIFGGPYFAFYNSPKPNWFKDRYGSYAPHDSAQWINESPETLHGGNLFIKRNLLNQTGGFNPNLGMKGKKMAYGEETALLKHIKANQPETTFYFDPDLWLYHLVRPEKMEWKWILKSNFSKGLYNYHVFGNRLLIFEKITKSILLFFAIILVGVPKSLIGLIFRSRNAYPDYQQFLYENALVYVKYLGWITEHLFGIKAKQNE